MLFLFLILLSFSTSRKWFRLISYVWSPIHFKKKIVNPNRGSYIIHILRHVEFHRVFVMDFGRLPDLRYIETHNTFKAYKSYSLDKSNVTSPFSCFAGTKSEKLTMGLPLRIKFISPLWHLFTLPLSSPLPHLPHSSGISAPCEDFF